MKRQDMPETCGKRQGFSLVELLVVVAAIAILMGLLLPALKVAKQKAFQTFCANNMKQMGLAINSYTIDNDDWMPLSRIVPPYPPIPGNVYSWLSEIHEYIDGKPLTSTHISNVFTCPAGEREVCWTGGNGGNYMYDTYLGNYSVTWGYPTYASYGPRKLGRCRAPANCAVVIDGQNKTKDLCIFDFGSFATAVAYVHFRHSKGTNVLLADAHVEWDNFAKTDDAIRERYRYEQSWVIGYFWPR